MYIARAKTMLITVFISFTVLVYGQNKAVNINIDLAKTYQVIDNFGASDAWACQFIGNWPDAKRNQIADLLFSLDTLANGSPKGIALSLWRFNIGAGSAQQGEQSTIPDEWHRAESFLNSNGSYNWQAQAGQVWFLKAARQQGVKQFLGFANSPPVQFTLNGLTHASNGKTNIVANQYNAFADYLSAVVTGVEKISGVRFSYISPVNEPQWDWSDNKQEGSPYHNNEISGLVKAIDQSFHRDKIKSKILVAEAGSIDYLLPTHNKVDKNNQINDFFDPASSNYIGGLKYISNIICAHSYFTTSPMASSIKKRTLLAGKIATVPGLKFWQSEYCILGDNSGEINGQKRDLGIDAALYLASVISTDLTVANASAWQWWTAISPYDYKDGLIYVDKNKTDGNFYPAKMLWALGNYSRFIRPGAVRVNAEVSGDGPITKPVLVSAFKQNKNFVAVIVNQNNSDVSIRLNVINGDINRLRLYTTDATNDLKPGAIVNNNILTIPANSIISLTGLIR